jgi:hypothetical protein
VWVVVVREVMWVGVLIGGRRERHLHIAEGHLASARAVADAAQRVECEATARVPLVPTLLPSARADPTRDYRRSPKMASTSRVHGASGMPRAPP